MDNNRWECNHLTCFNVVPAGRCQVATGSLLLPLTRAFRVNTLTAVRSQMARSCSSADSARLIQCSGNVQTHTTDASTGARSLHMHAGP